MKDKIDRLLEALEQPERFSEEEISELLADSEISELYGMMSKTSDALTETGEPDIDLEWKSFAKKQGLLSRQNIGHPFIAFFGRNAAAVVLCVLASLAVVAATLGATYSMGQTKTQQDRPEAAAQPALDRTPGDSLIENPAEGHEPRIIIFKDKALAYIISDIAEYYGVTTEYNSNDSRELRLYFQWDQSAPLSEVVEQLNYFEHIQISLTDSTLHIE
ncbi:MAG: DUF4974 domain-containing protein [Muribaculaceae bacterium]|nr:DUF4974 domain-containing protein [Muribaculaceae bacterium]